VLEGDGVRYGVRPMRHSTIAALATTVLIQIVVVGGARNVADARPTLRADLDRYRAGV
jgi:imidazole glycerol phosphate synthase subunit HisF